jgi:hypothetical protein
MTRGLFRTANCLYTLCSFVVFAICSAVAPCKSFAACTVSGARAVAHAQQGTDGCASITWDVNYTTAGGAHPGSKTTTGAFTTTGFCAYSYPGCYLSDPHEVSDTPSSAPSISTTINQTTGQITFTLHGTNPQAIGNAAGVTCLCTSVDPNSIEDGWHDISVNTTFPSTGVIYGSC